MEDVQEQRLNETSETEELTQNLRRWIELDDEARKLSERLKEIRAEKNGLSGSVLNFMKENDLDDFKIEGMSGGSLSRSLRTFKPAIKRNTIRTQLLIHFGDQPSRVSEALRAIEGIGEGEDSMSVGVQKEMLMRHMPRKPRNQSSIQLNG